MQIQNKGSWKGNPTLPSLSATGVAESPNLMCMDEAVADVGSEHTTSLTEVPVRGPIERL